MAYKLTFKEYRQIMGKEKISEDKLKKLKQRLNKQSKK